MDRLRTQNSGHSWSYCTAAGSFPAPSSVERFGVFVALDDGPDHPVFPGVGFSSFSELSWRRFGAATDVVRVGHASQASSFSSTRGTWRPDSP